MIFLIKTIKKTMTDLTAQELVDWNCPMANTILAKKCISFCEENDYEYSPMTFEDFNSWEPTEEDIPGLVESIKFWTNLKPKGERDTWSKLQFKLYAEAVKKEKMLLNTLNKVENIAEAVCNHIDKERRVLLKQKLKNKINNAQSYRR